MSLHLSVRSEAGKFVSHTTVLNTFAYSLGGFIVMTIAQNLAGLAIDYAIEKVMEYKAESAAAAAAEANTVAAEANTVAATTSLNKTIKAAKAAKAAKATKATKAA